MSDPAGRSASGTPALPAQPPAHRLIVRPPSAETDRANGRRAPIQPRSRRYRRNLRSKMARATGLEPAASGVTGRRSNQLSYARSPPTRRPRSTRRAVAVRPRYGFARSKSSFARPKASRQSVAPQSCAGGSTSVSMQGWFQRTIRSARHVARLMPAYLPQARSRPSHSSWTAA
jgi:hypothetical protein